MLKEAGVVDPHQNASVISDCQFGPSAMWEHRIRQRAYEIYEAGLQNHASSSDWQDWLQAEREILREIRGSQEFRAPEQNK
jgi:hypothetical protein